VSGSSLSCKDILNDLPHTSQVGVCVNTSYEGNSFVAVVVVFHVAIKLPHFSSGAGVGPTFDLCVSAEVLLPILGNKTVWISGGLSDII
jgi:hypothetical protein